MCLQGEAAQSTALVCQSCVAAAVQALQRSSTWTMQQCAQALRDQLQQAANCYAWSVSSADDFDGTRSRCDSTFCDIPLAAPCRQLRGRDRDVCQAVSGSFWDLAELGHTTTAPVAYYAHCLQVMAQLPRAGNPLRRAVQNCGCC